MRLALALLLAPAVAMAQPELRGPHPIEERDAGRVSLDGASIRVRVFAPSDVSANAPLVAVVHGYLRNGAFMAEMARTLASRGMLAVVPDMPCDLAGCDHDANAAQLRALLAWAALDPAIGPRIDPTRRAIIGHSWGALATFLASTQAGSFEAMVLLDPNDDRRAAADRAGQSAVPWAILRAERGGNCNDQWLAAPFDASAAPRLRLTVEGSAHCDAEEPSDNLCPIACGRGDPAKSAVFRRYAIAFVGCVLQADRELAPYVEGARRAEDEAAGLVSDVAGAGLGTLPCAPVSGPEDAGAAEDDALVLADAASDARVVADATALDARAVTPDAGLPAATEAESCASARGSGVAVLAALAALRRRRTSGCAGTG